MSETYPFLYGRLPIYTSIKGFDPNRPEEIIYEVNQALSIHVQNLIAMEYLYWYRRGITPIYAKEKTVREEINNKISENHAGMIVDWKDGYFLAQPAFYTSRREDEETAEKVKQLNDYLYVSGKQSADNKVVDWFHTVGKGDLFVQSVDDPDTPYKAYSLDPRSAFVAMSLEPGNEPVFAVHSVVNDNKLTLDVWDKNYVYKLEGTVTGRLVTPDPDYMCTAVDLVSYEPNPLGLLPIVEYFYNSVRQSAFEPGIPILDAINQVQSDRLDGLDQFIQSLLVFYNCELGEDEDGNQITPAYVRAAGAVFLKAVGENKADLKEISSQLDQSQTQVLVENLYEQLNVICGLPDTTTKSSRGDTGVAVELRDGFRMAETMARNTEDLFRESNSYFDRIVTKILRDKNILDISPADFALNFTRNEIYGMQSKAQAFSTLVTAGYHPVIAMAKSGVSADPVADYEASKGYLRLRWGDPDAPAPQPTTDIVEEDRTTTESLADSL